MRRLILVAAIASIGGVAYAHDTKSSKGTCRAGESIEDCRERLEKADGISREAREEGQDVRASMNEARREARETMDRADGNRSRMGMVRNGDVRNSITTDPLAVIAGEGVNLRYEKPFLDKWSWLVGGNYSRTSIAGGSVSAFGVTGGVDYYILGRDNEGFFVGPRLGLEGGANTAGGDTTGLAGVGVAGETGYNYIAGNGLTLGAAAGLGAEWGGIFGDRIASNNSGVDFNPYAKLNAGYSW